ncbi:Protein of unknown function [Pyronema omphalodes CBS 100304]|uniref:Uncharacterized protein n=1 Tax=Pyronema omphalodes (strain CBS 100304) TaxID=1076935 RepID=U4LD89_PYROM|nr:Protein of unknown function [Pyronema omphalodes CBS 100304]
MPVDSSLQQPLYTSIRNTTPGCTATLYSYVIFAVR